ncbi:MAG TPA: peptidase inhibitor family I36 protein [Kofleriaceae bacterium]|jgi:hypothetical protein
MKALLLFAVATVAGCATDSTPQPEAPEGWDVVALDSVDSGLAIVPHQSFDGTAEVFACPAGFLCVYQNGGRNGAAFGIYAGDTFSNLKGMSCPQCTNGEYGNDGTFNDQMSSWQNNSGERYCWYWDKSYGGEKHVMNDGYIVTLLARENDRPSSLKPC